MVSGPAGYNPGPVHKLAVCRPRYHCMCDRRNRGVGEVGGIVVPGSKRWYRSKLKGMRHYGGLGSACRAFTRRWGCERIVSPKLVRKGGLRGVGPNMKAGGLGGELPIFLIMIDELRRGWKKLLG